MDCKDWKLIPGDYKTGNEKSSVAVLTLLDEFSFNENKVAIYGKAMTENLGVTRILANLLSNPNIRYLIICGRDVKGHFPGDALVSLYNNGYDISEFGSISIRNTKAADPKLAIKKDSIEDVVNRFRNQITLIDMRSERDIGKINNTIEDCLKQNSQPLSDAYIVELKTIENLQVTIQDNIAIHSRIKLNNFYIRKR